MSISSNSFEEKDAFVGYHQSTPAAIVFQASKQLHQYVQELERGERDSKLQSFYLWEKVCRTNLLEEICLDELLDVTLSSEKWKKPVRCAYTWTHV